MEAEKIYLPNSRGCFVCGEENRSGLQARFFVEDGTVKMPLRATGEHCGFPNTVHGGIIAAALDECMSWAAARTFGRFCLTAELQVRFLRPVPLEGTPIVRAEVTKEHRRMVHARAVLEAADGTVYARGKGTFLPLTEEETLAVDEMLVYRGNEERPFEALSAGGADGGDNGGGNA